MTNPKRLRMLRAIFSKKSALLAGSAVGGYYAAKKFSDWRQNKAYNKATKVSSKNTTRLTRVRRVNEDNELPENVKRFFEEKEKLFKSLPPREAKKIEESVRLNQIHESVSRALDPSAKTINHVRRIDTGSEHIEPDTAMFKLAKTTEDIKHTAQKHATDLLEELYGHFHESKGEHPQNQKLVKNIEKKLAQEEAEKLLGEDEIEKEFKPKESNHIRKVRRVEDVLDRMERRRQRRFY